MAKKLTGWKTKGMNKDLSVSSYNPEFCFENRNLRLLTNEHNTMLSWVNEKGTLNITLSSNIQGYPIGTAVLNEYLVIFTTTNSLEVHPDAKTDRIYRLNYNNTAKTSMTVVQLINANLNFSTNNPIETLVSYESEYVQKVYWTDGRNQPRLINIVDTDKLTKWSTAWTSNKVFTLFDFVPAYSKGETATVTKKAASGGVFAPGVIQYCFTYVNKYGQQSNIVWSSTLYYISHTDRGAAPDEMVPCSFYITISGFDRTFDYIRLYSIHRTSFNDVPEVKLIEDIAIPATGNISYTDSGTMGISVDPTEMLYIGGRELIASTLADKNNTLFLGNLSLPNSDISTIQEYFRNNSHSITYSRKENPSASLIDRSGGTYRYTNSMSSNFSEISTFKGGEWYRFGIQLQKDNGEWSEPIFINDVKNTLYPDTPDNLGGSSLSKASTTIDVGIIGNGNVYKRVRPIVVYPTITDRSVICQGVINPTVFNIWDRLDNSPFAQPSWFFRPYMQNYGESEYEDRPDPRGGTQRIYLSRGSSLPFMHYQSLVTVDDVNSPMIRPRPGDDKYSAKQLEIQGAKKIISTVYDDLPRTQTTLPNGRSGYGDIDKSANNQFFIDQSIVTLNSPDIDFDTDVQTFPLTKTRLRIIGYIPITAGVSAHHIDTQSAMLELNHNVPPADPNNYVPQFGTGEKDINSVYNNIDQFAGNRLCADYLWNDACVIQDLDQDDKIKTKQGAYNYLIHPWHRADSLNNDFRTDEPSSKLKTKKMSQALFSLNTKYTSSPVVFDDIDALTALTESNQILNMRFKSGDNYYANVDKVLYNSNGYTIIDNQTVTFTKKDAYSPVSMKYMSTSHMAIKINQATISTTPMPNLTFPTKIMPYGNSEIGKYTNPSSTMSTTYWEKSYWFDQDSITVTLPYNYLWLGEIYRNDADITNRFGGITDEAIRSNKWVIGGDAVNIPTTGDVTVTWVNGDTYYQRYDCMKTYPFTQEDPNQNTEILSFMCETHINIDGRYDRNRGLTDNTKVSPVNFNLLNPVYSQKNNFFPIVKGKDANINKYSHPNKVTYSKTKSSGADVDLWTNVTLASILELDGDKGQIHKLVRFNDTLLSFQDKGVAQILYNENVQISTQQGVPVEIANSGKVQGARYLSDTIGCSDKWTIVPTPTGIYFIDSIGKTIQLFNGQLNDVSANAGFISWAKRNIPDYDINWNPTQMDTYASYYDRQNQEVLFIDKGKCLAYSERFGAFTSFYDYNGTPYFNNVLNTGVWVRTDGTVWKHNAGDYCKFFGNNKPYSMILIGNPEPMTDCIFTNLEFRAGIDGDGNYNQETDKFTPFLPFDTLETWNEYQHGIAYLRNLSGSAAMKHHTYDNIGSVKRKFRIWRCDIPRDNAPDLGVFDYTFDETFHPMRRLRVRPLDRMRNPWIYLRLQKEAQNNMPRAEIHDILMTYFS